MHSEDAKFVVYMIGLATKVERYIIYALEQQNTLSEHVAGVLAAYKKELADFLRGAASSILTRWMHEASAEVPTGYQSTQTAQNIPTLSVVHSYLGLCWGNLDMQETGS